MYKSWIKFLFYSMRQLKMFCYVLWLIWNTFVFRCVASDSTPKRQTVRFRTVVLSITMHAKRRVVVRRVVLRCHIVARLKSRIGYLYIHKPSDRATLRQRTAPQRAVWCSSLATRRKGDNDIGCVVIIDKATRKVYQINPYSHALLIFSKVIWYVWSIYKTVLTFFNHIDFWHLCN
jgi:hypothetical protein